MITLADIQSDPDFRTLIERSGASLKGRGYTEHGLRHVTYVAEKAAQILTELGFDDRTVELAAIAGYLHDVGNLFNRKDHGITEAALVQELRRKGMDLDEICTITGAIGNHESNGRAVSPVSAA